MSSLSSGRGEKLLLLLRRAWFWLPWWIWLLKLLLWEAGIIWFELFMLELLTFWLTRTLLDWFILFEEECKEIGSILFSAVLLLILTLFSRYVGYILELTELDAIFSLFKFEEPDCETWTVELTSRIELILI